MNTDHLSFSPGFLLQDKFFPLFIYVPFMGVSVISSCNEVFVTHFNNTRTVDSVGVHVRTWIYKTARSRSKRKHRVTKAFLLASWDRAQLKEIVVLLYQDQMALVAWRKTRIWPQFKRGFGGNDVAKYLPNLPNYFEAMKVVWNFPFVSAYSYCSYLWYNHFFFPVHIRVASIN